MTELSLYPYQEEGRDFLATRKRAYLSDEMGLGKTVQALTAAKKIRAGNVLVISPASAVENWIRERNKWYPGGTFTYMSYAKALRSRDSLGTPGLVILDEAHYCKTPSAKRTRAALGVASKADRAWLLSGTPMPNDPTELWAMFKYLWPERPAALDITTAEQWMHKFCKVRATEWGPKPYAVKNGAILKGMLEDIMMRRTLDQVGLDLPPLRVTLSYLPKDADLARGLQEYSEYEDGDPEQVYTSTLRRLLGKAKAPRIAKQVAEELTDGAYKAIVLLYYHREVGALLRETLEEAGHTCVGFDGSTPQTMRQRAIDAFQSGGAPVFLAQMTSAGVAITLTRASELVLVEPEWSPDDNRQAIKRIHRIGQDHPCRARIFAVQGTLDASVMWTVARKVQMQQEVGLG